jgi:hypothetical protein
MDPMPGGGAGVHMTDPTATGSGGMSATSTGSGGMSAMRTGSGGMGGSGGAGGGTGGASGGTGGSMAMGPKPTKLTASITTKTQGGRYAPKNVGAIWIEDSSGKWVYTLEWWSSLLNAGALTQYTQVKGPTYTFFDPKPGPDVITGATLTMHKTHAVSWGLEGMGGSEVPDGAYNLVIESSEQTQAEGGGQVQKIPFTKGPDGVMLTPADTQYFTGMKLTLE